MFNTAEALGSLLNVEIVKKEEKFLVILFGVT